MGKTPKESKQEPEAPSESQEPQEEGNEQLDVSSFGFEIDTGRSRASSVDPKKLEKVLQAAKQSISDFAEQTKDPSVKSVSMPLAQLNKALGINSHNAHSLVYNISENKATKPLLSQYGIKMGRRGKYDAPVAQTHADMTGEDRAQGVSFELVPDSQ